MTAPKDFPALRDGEHAVLQADPMTGTVLDENGNWSTQGAHYYVFATRAEAERFADDRQAEKPCSEWWIYDGSRNAVARRLALESPPPPPPPRLSVPARFARWIRSLLRRRR